MSLLCDYRYEGEHEVKKDEEQNKLDKLFKKIENKKKKKKEKNTKLAEAIAETTIRRQIKRDIKSQIIEVPENDITEFNNEIDEVSPAYEKEKSPKPVQLKGKQNGEHPPNFEGFTILGAENSTKKEKVKRVLPKWLAEPTVITTNLKELQTKVSSIKSLDKGLRKKLKENGVKYFFPVQAEVIPWLLQSIDHSCIEQARDICVSAPTGSGKTLAFALPVIQGLKAHRTKKIRALVVLPTQDLALQVFETFKLYCENTNVDVCIITKENSFALEEKMLISKKTFYFPLCPC